MGVTYRKRGNRWQIRFREKGKKEVTETLPGTLRESTIQKRVGWWEQQIALGREDPWADSGNKDVILIDAIHEYCSTNISSGKWTQETYRTTHNRLTYHMKPIIDRSLGSLDEDHFQDLLNNLQVRPSTKRSIRASWNGFFEFLHASEYTTDRYKVELDVADNIAIRNDKRIKYLTWQQVDDVCSAIRFIHRQRDGIHKYTSGRGAEYYCDVIWFMFYSLLRKEEVPRLKVKDLLPSGWLRVHGKGRKVDIIPLPPPALRIAKRHAEGKSPEEPLLVQHMSRPYKNLKDGIRMALAEDHPTGFHQLRHGGVVHYFTLGKPIQFISKLCRHASMQVTLVVYADVIDDGLAAAFSDIDHGPAAR